MDLDFFKFFRYMLGWIVTIYATIITVQSLWGWFVWLTGTDRYSSMLRRYIILQGLRLRVRKFWGDCLVCLLLTIAFCMLWRAQIIMDSLESTLKSNHLIAVRHKQASTHSATINSQLTTIN